ncbi:DUF2252 domain-containing protein [Vineibacter terrae]|uniref:DUF2252 domain-containing protein n=1 Tax=Vineibacter terrae TaxID=2586908 RepID=A0A5C8PUE9_9HYPH|nr:DUF2252 domain-containing protein [Vineibacter terrae]TXL81529.1 DUF2252 domain-containing protein [Vineibacter terrae]
MASQIPSRQARREHGKALRKACPRASHAEPGSDLQGRDPVALIEASNVGRLPHLLAIRHERMAESAFAFFRGTALIQAHDLARTPSSGITVQACGDCHLLNFGGFATPERALVFDVNDFDETFAAPWEWDLKRLATSFVLAARWRALGSADAAAAAFRAVEAYKDAQLRYAGMKTMEIWYDHLPLDALRAALQDDAVGARQLDALIDKARHQTCEQIYHKLTRPVDGVPRIVDQPPLLFHGTGDEQETRELAAPFLKAYRDSLSSDRRALFDRWVLVDAAHKVVGVGSVGTRCLIALLMADADDPLFLQVKEARASVLEGFAGPSPWASNGERVVTGQRLMQAASDIFLGWARDGDGRDFYIRQLRDMKTAADITRMNGRLLKLYADLCGRCLARAHAKAGDAAAIAGYLGSGDAMGDAVSRYAVRYADQVERDHALFLRAVRGGRLPIRPADETLVR